MFTCVNEVSDPSMTIEDRIGIFYNSKDEQKKWGSS